MTTLTQKSLYHVVNGFLGISNIWCYYYFLRKVLL